MKQILFNTENVRALLEGRKTVTRRAVKFKGGQNPAWTGYIPDGAVLYGSNNIPAAKAPYQPGNILWVRETFRVDYLSNIPGAGRVQYKDGTYMDIRFAPERYDMMRRAQRKPGWRPNENMPREAARIFLRVTGVRVERLQEITEDGAKAEGAAKSYPYTDPETGETVFVLDKDGTYRSGFSRAWDSTIPKHPNKFKRYPFYWDDNPWVWVIEFKRISKEEAEG